MSMLIAVFVIYLLVVMVAGTLAARHNTSMQAYFLADRSLGPWVAALSSVASSESGWIILGAVGMGYSEGASAVWFAPGCLAGYLINWYLLAPRLNRLTRETGAVTIPDLLQAMHDKGGSAIRIVAAVIIFFCMMGYVGAQFSASGKSFEAIFDMPFIYGVLIGAAVTVAYTLLGGLRAVAWTDTIQAGLMILGLVVMPIALVVSLGGPSEVAKKLENTPPRHLVEVTLTQADGTTSTRNLPPAGLFLAVSEGRIQWKDNRADILAQVFLREGKVLLSQPSRGAQGLMELAPNRSYRIGEAAISRGEVKTLVSGKDFTSTFGGKQGIALLGLVIGLLGIGLGYPGQPHVVTRYMALKKPAMIRRARLIAIVWGVLAYYGALTLGHLARLSHPALSDPEYAYPEVALSLFPPVLAGLILAALLAAIMSTADSQLLVAASAVTRDLYEKVFGRGGTGEEGHRRKVRVSRITIFLLGGLSVLFALFMTKVIFWLVLFAWSGLGAAFGPILLIGCWWRGVTKWGALAGMITGFVTTIVWYYTLKPYLYELVPAFILSALAIVAVSLMTGKDKQ